MSDHADSYVDTAGTEPFEFYDALRQTGGVTWDEGLHGWLVSSYAACRQVFQQDDRSYGQIRQDLLPEGMFASVQGGERHINFLTGDDHTKLHRWWLAQFSRDSIAEHRRSVIRPTIERVLDEAGDGRIELIENVTRRVPFMVVLSLLGVPTDDREALRSLRDLLDEVQSLTDSIIAEPDVSAAEAAVAASAAIIARLDPHIESRRNGQGDDLISKLWRDGPDLLDNWTIADVRVNCRMAVNAGTDTTGAAMANALYVLATRPEVAERLRHSDEDGVERFVEEVLRMFGPVHYRERRAVADTRVGETDIRQGDFVMPLMGSAGRDPERYGCPHELRFDRKVPRDHMTFAAGPRVCAGAALARAELAEFVPAVLRRWKTIGLDESAPAPAYRGLLLRSYSPLHMRCERA